MASLKGIPTEHNIFTTFCGEPPTRTSYPFFARAAQKSGYVLISNIVTDTARQGKGYAGRRFQLPQGDYAEVIAAFSLSIVDNTS